MSARGTGPPNAEGRPSDRTASQQHADTKNLPDTPARYRSGLRACHMIDAAHKRDHNRFGRLYAEAERYGETDLKWTMLQLASACAFYTSTDDHDAVAFHAITATGFGGGGA